MPPRKFFQTNPHKPDDLPQKTGKVLMFLRSKPPSGSDHNDRARMREADHGGWGFTRIRIPDFTRVTT